MNDGNTYDLERIYKAMTQSPADRIEELEAKLALVIAAYRIEAMRRDDYSHDAFDQHIAELKGQIAHDLARASRCRHQPDLPIWLGHPLARKP